MAHKHTSRHINKVVEEWVKEQLEKGEDVEILKESLQLLNHDTSIVDKIAQNLNKQPSSLSPQRKKEDFIRISADRIIDDSKLLRFNVPKEVLPENESSTAIMHKEPLSNFKLKFLMLKKDINLFLALLGASLMLIGIYIYFYL